MSQILIKEQEQVGFNSFDATENVVLVPLLRTDGAPEAARLYSTLNEFIAAWGKNPPAIADSEASEEVEDKSYYFIKELLNAGLKVVVKPFEVEGTDIGQAVIDQVGAGFFDEFKSKNLWNVKFITTGYWPNVKVTVNDESSSAAEITGGCYGVMAGLAAERGDCVAVFEFPQELTPAQLLAACNVVPDKTYKFAVCSYPAAEYTLVTSTNSNLPGKLTMPASFGYLMAFANSIRTNADWFAASGIIRGSIPGLIKTNFEVTDSMMEQLQDGIGDAEINDAQTWKVNPIMQMGTYGIRLWGNRVVASGSNKGVGKLIFSDFLNVRMLLCDLKKQIYHSALRTTFEPNDDITWVNFKKLCNGLLDQMQSGRGISWYSWRKVKVDRKATIKAVLTIKPIEAVEYFDITINLSDEEVSVSEEEDIIV